MKLHITRGFFTGYVSLTLALILYFLNTVPAFGWDTLSFWAAKVVDYVTVYNNGTGTPAYSIREHRHPPAVILLQSSAMHLTNGKVMLPMVLPFLFFLSVVIYMPKNLPLGRRTGLAFLLVVITLSAAPLLTNHYLIYGYVEVYVGASMLLALILWQKGYCSNSGWVYFLFAILCALIPIMIKNTGVLYALAVLLSFFVVGVWRSGLGKVFKAGIFACLIGASTIPLLSVWNFSWTSTWMASAFSNDVASRTMWFGGYPLHFSYVGFGAVCRSVIQAVFVNQSFGVLFLTYLAAFSLAVTDRGRTGPREHSYFLMHAFVCAAFTLASFTIPQIFSERAYAFSAPDTDTGYSRFLIPVAMLSVIPLFAIYSRFKGHAK